jgi:hypothetical protein
MMLTFTPQTIALTNRYILSNYYHDQGVLAVPFTLPETCDITNLQDATNLVRFLTGCASI